MKKITFFLAFLFVSVVLPIHAESPIETVCHIGDKLIRETPFKYKLVVNPNNTKFDGIHFVDFGRTFGLGKTAEAYAYTEIISDRDTLFPVEIEHNDACKIWCNGALVYERDGERKLQLQQQERSMENNKINCFNLNLILI